MLYNISMPGYLRLRRWCYKNCRIRIFWIGR